MTPAVSRGATSEGHGSADLTHADPRPKRLIAQEQSADAKMRRRFFAHRLSCTQGVLHVERTANASCRMQSTSRNLDRNT